ncbi:hypothetical protein KKB18_05310 [bacterium]|nr:hypothetical protein [bacterium]
MSINSIFNDAIEVYRHSSTLYSGEISEISPEKELADEALIRITLDTLKTGSIYLNGSTTETLTFSNSKFAEGSRLFTTLSGVTPSGLSGEMKVESFNEAGEPVLGLNYITTALGHFAPKDNSQFLQPAGMSKKFNAMLYVGEDMDVQVGDIVVVEGEEEKYTVTKCVTIHSPNSESHKEIILM